ncbi:ATP-binding protein [Hyalangium rubrum]|uniref:histidine kinase n=1 Tax=Hyalangium rubrum TaxID=3103134 RepID=A0ABU5H2U0_9BACT|nr:ATP-binding protein [Hyalangium sp. s54d21]MDY7227596.1 ATP-binding protein [Hyalangium sp. s54d21]
MAPLAVTEPSRANPPAQAPRTSGPQRLWTSPVGHYALALLSVLGALLLQKAFWPFMSNSPFLFFYGAIVLAGWWGRWGPALVATALSMLAVDYFFLPPHDAFQLQPGDMVSLGIFLVLSLLVTRLNVALRRTDAERNQLLERERAARTEAEIERSRLQSLLMQAPACVALLRGPQHVYTLSNPLNDTLFGNRKLLGRGVREALPDAERQGLVDILDSVYSTGEPFIGREMSLKFLQPEGGDKEVWLDVIYQAMRDARGTIDGIACFGVDITASVRARREAEALAAELKRSEERYRTFVSQSSEGIFRVETVEPVSTSTPEEQQVDDMLRLGYVAECNDAMARMYGLEGASALVGARLEQLLVREDPRNIEYMRSFIRNGYRIENSVSHEMDHNGNPKIIVNNLIGMVREGALIAAWGIQRDITQQRQAEEARARAAANARFLAEASAVMASSLDYEATLRNLARLAVPALADWCVIDLQQPDGAFRRVEVTTATEEDAALAQRMKDFGLMPDGNVQHPPTQALLEGKALLIENFTAESIRARTHSAEHAEVLLATQVRSLICVPLEVRGRVLGVLSFLTSRSGRRYTAEDLTYMEELARRAALSVENARLYREAQEAIRLRDEFLSIASHELKTPLTPLSLKLQMLSREVRKQPDSPLRRSVEDYVAIGTRQVKKLSELVSDLLDVTRISGGKLRLEFEDVDLTTIVREVVGRYEPEAARLGTSLSLEAQGVVVGHWDRLRLEQVVTNLIDNALKYGAGKPVDVRLRVSEGKACLLVRDEGIGIAPEYLPRIFGRFERAVSERHYGGLGLGLYITRTIIEAMGGHIQVESQPGQGSTFTVELPLDPRTVAAPEPPSA